MDVRKAFAIGLSAGILGLQAYLIIPPQPQKRYRTWPFLDYPMYSRSHPATAVFRHYELRGQPCDGSPMRRLPASEVRMEDFVYWETLASAAGEQRGRGSPERAMERLSAVIGGTVGRRSAMCHAAVWRQEHPVRGFRGPDAPWTQVRAWPLTPHADTAS